METGRQSTVRGHRVACHVVLSVVLLGVLVGLDVALADPPAPAPPWVTMTADPAEPVRAEPVAAPRERGPCNVLFFAPHPDDEVIALGGWLHDQVMAGRRVFVVLMTDGSPFTKTLRSSTMIPAIFFTGHDYRKLARQRRQEAQRALGILGVPDDHRVFLARPSGILASIGHDPRGTRIHLCKATNQRYGVSDWYGGYRKTRAFTRDALAQDLDQLLADVQPDVVAVPASFDGNTDHQVTSWMVREALQRRKVQPKLLFYLVHYRSRKTFPMKYGYHPTEILRVPPPLLAPHSYTLSSDTLTIKDAAVRQHRSQIGLKDGFLLSFIRRNELYWTEN